jgi:HEXXH motif-containing protein
MIGLGALHDLTIPEPGSRAAREVYSRALGRLPRDLLAIPAGLPATAPGRADLAAVQALVRALAADARAGAPALLSVLRSPTVSALLRGVRNELARAGGDRVHADATLAELAATLAFELARTGAPMPPLRLERLPRRILSLAARAELTLPEGAEGASFAPGRMVIERGADRIDVDLRALADAPLVIARPYHAIDGGIFLATSDNNPRSSWGAEPGEPGNPVDLGDHAPEAWTAPLREALALIGEHLPELRAEIELYVQLFVPTGFHPETHRSASYRESIGAVYLTLHPQLMTLAEAVIHEFSHNKLHALFELDAVIENGSEKAFRSPVRPDLRPLRGVLLAVHAFLPVARLYERMAEAGHPLARQHYFPERFARIRAINREGASVIFSHSRPTAAGRALIDEFHRWIDHFGA